MCETNLTPAHALYNVEDSLNQNPCVFDSPEKLGHPIQKVSYFQASQDRRHFTSTLSVEVVANSRDCRLGVCFREYRTRKAVSTVIRLWQIYSVRRTRSVLMQNSHMLNEICGGALGSDKGPAGAAAGSQQPALPSRLLKYPVSW